MAKKIIPIAAGAEVDQPRGVYGERYDYEHSYVIKNDAASKLGAHTLLPRKVRIFIQTKEQPEKEGDPAGEGVAFTGEDWAPLTPMDRELKLSIGPSREVKVTQCQTKKDRTHIRRNNNNADVLWDTDDITLVKETRVLTFCQGLNKLEFSWANTLICRSRPERERDDVCRQCAGDQQQRRRL